MRAMSEPTAPTADDLPAHRYDAALAQQLEAGWQARWEAQGTFHTPNPVGDLSAGFEAVADRELVVEAASEREDVKTEIFRRVGQILTSSEAVLASNTSSIPIVKLGAASGRPEQVMGVHFFNPAPVMQLVELIPSLTTGVDTLTRMRRFVTDQLGKEAIDATDRAGFIVNSLLVPYLLSAIRMYEAGYAKATDIDRGMVLGCGHPMGPLALSDLIGLDTIRAIGASLYEEFKEPLYSPPPLLERMVEAGLLGKKSGHGFYPYQRDARG